MLAVVYGTLKKGYNNNYILRDHKLVTTGVVKGFELYNSGFPVANPNPETLISAEIWDIEDNQHTLQRLDALEGYYEDAPDRSMYLRQEVKFHGDDGTVYDGQMYVGNSRFWRDFKTMRHCSYDADNKTYTWGR